MHIVFFDNFEWRERFYPLSLTRPIADLRVGILTISEKWRTWLGSDYSYLTEAYLRPIYPLETIHDDYCIIRGNVLPDERLCEVIHGLKLGEGIADALGPVALRVDADGLHNFMGRGLDGLRWSQAASEINQLIHPEDVFLKNGEQIELDFKKLTDGRNSATLSSTNHVLGDRIFVEAGVTAECAIFNTQNGPIYLGKNSIVSEGAMIRGAFALGEGAEVKMGAKIYQDVTIGPQSKVGGEVSNSVIWGRSSKAHDGYMGNTVLGEWCNWGAGTSNSNLRNNYKKIKVYDYSERGFRETGLRFFGTIMGDHTKTAINTVLNTGTVAGVGSNIFGAGFPSTFIPDFSWGGSGGFSSHRLPLMMETAALVYARRDRTFGENDRILLEHIYELTRQHRRF